MCLIGLALFLEVLSSADMSVYLVSNINAKLTVSENRVKNFEHNFFNVRLIRKSWWGELKMYRILLLIITISVSLWPVNSYAQGNTKFGVVDGERLFDEYPAAQEATKKISDAQDELREAIAESEKIYGEFEKQKKSEAEKLTKQKELQAKIDVKARDTKKMIEGISSKIEQDILQSIKTIAAEKGLEVVLDKRAVLYGGADLTQPVLEVLKKKGSLAIQGENKKG